MEKDEVFSYEELNNLCRKLEDEVNDLTQLNNHLEDRVKELEGMVNSPTTDSEECTNDNKLIDELKDSLNTCNDKKEITERDERIMNAEHIPDEFLKPTKDLSKNLRERIKGMELGKIILRDKPSFRYRKKPVVVEAVQLTAYMSNNESDYPSWFVTANMNDTIIITRGALTGAIRYATIKTLEGQMTANLGDYIIQGVNGEIYPCKPDIFEKTYEEAGE